MTVLTSSTSPNSIILFVSNKVDSAGSPLKMMSLCALDTVEGDFSALEMVPVHLWHEKEMFQRCQALSISLLDGIADCPLHTPKLLA